MMSEPSELEKIRLEKLAQLEADGIQPFPRDSRRSHTTQEAIAAFDAAAEADQISATIAGRTRSMREMGKSTFAHLEDGAGRLQLYLRLDEIGEEKFNRFHQTVDIGDYLQVEGVLFRTKTGEVTLRVSDYRMLAKSLLPLPTPKKELVDGEEVIHDAFSDPEARYRQRYVDLAVNPEIRQIFRVRARMIQALRTFLDERGFLEVETPVLQPIYGGAAARPFVTHHNQLHQDLYLRISFELYLKRLLVGGIERVYEIGKDFRNEGVDRTHNPEFTQLEFYIAYAEYNAVMDLTEEMLSYTAEKAVGSTRIKYNGHQIDLAPPWRRLTLFDAVKNYADLDLEQLTESEPLREAMKKRKIDPGDDDAWGKLVDRVLSTAVEPHLIEPTFIHDFPRDISPFAKAKPDQPSIVERFEGFVGGIELCNAFTELNDPRDQKARFVEARETFQADDEDRHPMDEDYLRAMRYGMPPNGGFGMGVDRFAMLLTDAANIREVILFPHLRSQDSEEG